MREDISETRLENGLVVLTDRMPGLRSATLGFFFRVGARHEPLELNGITHFIEHCVFKGTGRRNARDIAIEQDRLGGNLDAFTTHEETGFVIKVIDDRIDEAFDLVTDMLTDPRFDDADCVNEQRVIIEEIKMNDDSPEETLGDIFHREFFLGHPLGRPITGTPASVVNFDQTRTSSFHSAAFVAENLIVAAAGNIDHAKVVDLVGRFEFRRGNGNIDSLGSQTSPVYAAPIVIQDRGELEQAHLLLATPFVNARDERRYAADLLANVIGGGTSSRLWQKIREEHGLAYSVGTSAAMYLDGGFLAISAATSPEQVEEVLDIALDELRWILREGISADELELMKHQARASILLGLEDSAGRAGLLAQCEITHGRQITVEETLKRLDAVIESDVREVASEFFKTEKIAFVALGDLGGLEITRDRLAVD